MFLSTTLSPTADGYVRDGSYSTTNYGSATDLQTKYSSTPNDGYIRDTYLKFDLSSVSSIGTATLELYGDVNSSETLSLGAFPVPTTSWTETGITWNNAPSTGSVITTTAVSGTSPAWFSWNISSYLQTEKADGINTVAIGICGTTSTSGYADFNSRQASSNQPQLVITPAASAPTVATAASASPSPVTGTTTALSVLGADSSGESVLTYTWAATSVPSGAATPTYSTNGVNASKNSTVTFYTAGAYTLQATITDPGTGLTTTSSVNVTVSQTQAGTLSLSPTSAAVANGGTQQFTATAEDQFGNAMASQPTITWGLGTGAIGSISSGGLYTAPSTGTHTDTVTASGGGSTGTATATVTNIIAPTADSYVYDANPDTNYGSATSLQVKYSNTSGYNREAYVKFPISGLGSISDAVLRLYGDDNGTTENVSVTADDSSNNSWTESGIAWNNRPTIADANLATVTTSGTTNSWYSWDITSYIQAQVTAGASYVTLVLRGTDNTSELFQFSSKEGANPEQLVITPAANAAPTIATAAAASPSTVTATTTNLSVLGADEGGESALTYTWAATSVPAGASAPTFSANGSNGAKNTTATFSAAGNYTFLATATDAGGLTATSSVNVTVGQTLTSISASPGSASLNENATQQFTASGLDQFGVALTSQPTFTWSNSGVGSVNSTGLYTAPGSTGTATVTATSGSVSANTSVTVGNAAPTVATAASASPSSVSGTYTDLSALGADDGGESNLTYTWATTGTPPAPVFFDFNGTHEAASTTASFSAAGDYTFQVTIADQGGLYVTSSVSVTVNQTLTSISVTPGTTSLDENAAQQFAATAFDQFDNAMATQPAFTWSNTGVGSVNSTGLYTAPGSAGTATVTATSGSVSANASVTVGNAAPTVATAAAASPSPVTGTTTTLSALGADDGGESNLTYTWTATSIPSGAAAPTYSANDSNAAKSDTATFTSAGDYTFQVTITDQGSLYATSSVSVTVNQTVTSISVTPGTATVGSDGTQQFTATATDQFGVAMGSPPTFTWSNSGAGSVDSAGLYTAPAALGSDTVTATSGGVSGDASVTVGGPSVATAASASTSDGINVDLSTLGADPNGESALTYTWTATSTPSGASVSFSNNGANFAKDTIAAVDTLGSYTFNVTISDGSNSVDSAVSISVAQVVTAIQINQPGAAVVTAGTFSFSATASDQFGDQMTTQPTFSWSVSGAGGTIESDGTYTAPSSGTGTDTVTASVDGTNDTTLVETGPIVGNVYDDSNSNSSQDAGEDGLSGWTVYADTNGDGSFGSGDPSTTTDVNGNYALDASGYSCGGGSCGSGSCGSGSGSATLMAVAQSGWSLTQGSGGYSVPTTPGSTLGPEPFGASGGPTASVQCEPSPDVEPTYDAFGGATGSPASTTFAVTLCDAGPGDGQIPAAGIASQNYSVDAGANATIVGVSDTLGSQWQIDGSTASVEIEGPNTVASFNITVTATYSTAGYQEVDLNCTVQCLDATGAFVPITAGSSSRGRQIKAPASPGPVSTPNAIYCINDPTAVVNQGHSAAIIPNGSGCTYYSYSVDGGVTTMNFNNITDALAAAKQAGYTREEHWNCNAQQASSAAAAAAAFNGTKYDPSIHNCWHMVISALQAANKQVDDAETTPNKGFNDNASLANGSSDL